MNVIFGWTFQKNSRINFEMINDIYSASETSA
jgi:hypothetical protein